MRLRIAALAGSIICAIFPIVSAESAPLTGSACTKQNYVAVIDGSKFTCTKSGKKLIWSKGTKLPSSLAIQIKNFQESEKLRAENLIKQAKLDASEISTGGCNYKLQANGGYYVPSVTISYTGNDWNLQQPSFIVRNPLSCDLKLQVTLTLLCPTPDKSNSFTKVQIRSQALTLGASSELQIYERNMPDKQSACFIKTGYRWPNNQIHYYTDWRSDGGFQFDPSFVDILSLTTPKSFNKQNANKEAQAIIANTKKSADQIIANSQDYANVIQALAEAQALEKAEAERVEAEKAAAEKAEAEKAAADMLVGKKCFPGSAASPCVVGSIGPGGGIVFYDGGFKQPWGARYLEYAPAGWYDPVTQDDPSTYWCDWNFSIFRSLSIDYWQFPSSQIGMGFTNTMILGSVFNLDRNCLSGASSLATSYSGGGFIDWFLPSRGELELMSQVQNDLYALQNTSLRTSFKRFSDQELIRNPDIKYPFHLQGVTCYDNTSFWSSSEQWPRTEIVSGVAMFRCGFTPLSYNYLLSVRPIRMFN